MIPYWKKHLLRQICAVFFFCLVTIYVLYALIDYSLHVQDFVKNSTLSLYKLGAYYLHQFLKRADLLLPLTLVITTIKVFLTLNLRLELLALHMAGLSARTLLRPLFSVAILCTLFNYANGEFLSPHSLTFIDAFDQTHFKHSYKGKRKEPFHIFPLKDGSTLVYQYYDHEKNGFYDVFWIVSHNELWHMKYLYQNPSLEGTYVDHLIRNANGEFTKGESLTQRLFPEIRWSQDMQNKGPIPFENRSLGRLLKLYTYKQTSPIERACMLPQILIKLIMPTLSLLVVYAIAPFCLRYKRGFPIFLIYALSLFGFLAFFTCMDASVILAGGQHISPFIAILTPFILCTFLSYGNYVRLTK